MEPELLIAKQSELNELKEQTIDDELAQKMVAAHEGFISSIIQQAAKFNEYLLKWYESAV